jgi:uncharacterized protein (UPF0335 family)
MAQFKELKSIVERIEKLMDEAAEVREAISDIKKEAKGKGYDAKVIAQIIKLRAMPADQRQEHTFLLTAYAEAIGIEDFK